MTIWSPNMYDAARYLEPTDAPGAAPSPKPKKVASGDERTAAQVVQPMLAYGRDMGLNLSYAGLLVGSQAYPGLSAVPILPGTYATYREMSRDETLALAIAAGNAPVKASKPAFNSKKDAPSGALDDIRENIEPMYSHIVDEFLKSREFGFRAFEKVFAEGEDTVLKRLKPLLPELTTIRYEQRTGRFQGFRNTAYTNNPKAGDARGGIIVPLESALLYTHDIDGDDYYGRPLHENSRRAYSYWLYSTGNRFRAQRKLSGIIVQVHYPPGKSTSGGVEKDNSVIAQELLEQIGLTNSVALPNAWADENNLHRGGTDGKPQWIISVLNGGSTGDELSAIAEDSKYWDVLKLRGWLVPERAVTEGQFGTKAEAESHGDILLSVAEEEAAEIARTVNWHVIDQILAMKYGEEARGSVWIEPQPLVDSAKATIKEVLLALLTRPEVGADIVRQVQMRTAVEKLGLPMNDDVDIDKDPTPVAPPPGMGPDGKPLPKPGMNGENGHDPLERLSGAVAKHFGDE